MNPIMLKLNHDQNRRDYRDGLLSSLWLLLAAACLGGTLLTIAIVAPDLFDRAVIEVQE